jgi:hypothetical protein
MHSRRVASFAAFASFEFGVSGLLRVSGLFRVFGLHPVGSQPPKKVIGIRAARRDRHAAGHGHKGAPRDATRRTLPPAAALCQIREERP